MIDLNAKVAEILKGKPDYTGQITIEIHCKAGEVKDVYVTERAKVHVTQ